MYAKVPITCHRFSIRSGHLRAKRSLGGPDISRSNHYVYHHPFMRYSINLFHASSCCGHEGLVKSDSQSATQLGGRGEKSGVADKGRSCCAFVK